MALVTIPTRWAQAAPADVFTIAAPAIGSDPPKAADHSSGDASVSTQTGQATYSYPIRVPPGRHGMAPQIALSYSSQSAIYGALAAGWTLGGVPIIAEDTSQGRLATHDPVQEILQGPAAGDDDRFTSSLAGDRPMFPVAEPAPLGTDPGVYKSYRAQNDSTFTRYERMNAAVSYRWRAFTTDGKTLYFGDDDSTGPHAGSCTNRSDGYAPLTREVDEFGNEVHYTYAEAVAGECRLASITWGQNASAGISTAFATVQFNYAATLTTCNGMSVGSQTSYRSGRRLVTGASRLDSITVTAYPPGQPATPDHTRTIALAYSAADASCTASHAPVWLLTSIQETAVGTNSPQVVLPAITFDYGAATVDRASILVGTTPWTDAFRRYNLGTGRRRVGNDDRWPTVEAMMIDVDGDGLVDRVESAPARDASGRMTACRAIWYRNTGTTFSLQPSPISLPNLQWKNGGYASTSAPDYEDCGLNGQVTAYANTSPRSSCPTGSCRADGFCDDGYPCQGSTTTNSLTILAYRWLDVDGDGLVDVVASVQGDFSRYKLEGDLYGPEPPPGGGSWWPSCNGDTIPTCGALSTTCLGGRSCGNGLCSPNWPLVTSCLESSTDDQCELHAGEISAQFYASTGGSKVPTEGAHQAPQHRYPYERCFGRFPWLVYKNLGNGQIATTATVFDSPVPLEGDLGDSSLVGPSVMSQNHGVFDVDGDGLLDAVVRARDADMNSNLPPWWWYVWRGDGTGRFESVRHLFSARDYGAVSQSGFVGSDAVVTTQVATVDLNGDGLPDNWTATGGTPPANAAWNDGTSFRLTSGGTGETDLGVRPGEEATQSLAHDPITPSIITSGIRSATSRLIDVDADGRPDLVTVAGGSAQVYFNLGGWFAATPVPYPGDSTGITHVIFAQRGDDRYPWDIDTDDIDLDGDGISESVYWSDTTMYRIAPSLGSGPPRLMTAVHAPGLDTSIVYTSMHDPSTVEQHPEIVTFGRPKASPRTQWVVQSVTAHDAVAGTDTTSSYYYVDPAYNSDDEGKYAFRGFETVKTTGPSGAITEQHYSYAPDWSGRLDKTVVHAAEDPASAVTVDATLWTWRQLFGNITTFHAASSEHWTCNTGQTEAACTQPGAAAGHTLTTMTLTACGLGVASDGACSSTSNATSPVLWTTTSSRLQAGTNAADGDRQTLSSFDIYATATAYRVRPRVALRQSQVAGAMTTFAKTKTDWDGVYAAATDDEAWVDTDDMHRAITHRVYDGVGNLIQRWKPVQNAAHTTKLSLTYDARRLFATTEVDEKAMERDSTYEYGTGTKLVTAGPNIRTCTTGCPTDSLHPVKETHQTRVDGLGRPIEQWEPISTDGSVYTLTELSTTSYVDTSPRSSTTQHLITYDSPTQTKTKTDVDGHGRPIRVTTYTQGSAPVDAITTSAYANDGTLRSVTLPDPTANDATTVTFTYTYDSLGRATSLRRPDATGIDLAYHGTTKTATEVLGGAGGNAAVTTTISDSFGRLAEVDELVTSTRSAATHYGYGPDDKVAQVTDPEGVATTLTHDFLGHRTQITRGGRSWKYGYDKNGNLISEQVPGSTGPTDEVNYTSTIAYDDLDRPTSKVNAKLTLSAADQALFGGDHETFTYDYPGNRMGRLVYWGTYAPGASTATLAVQNGYDAQGNLFNVRQTFNGAGFTSLQRTYRNDKNLLGQPWVYFYDDLVGGSNQTTGRVYFDARGLPQKYVLLRTGMANQDVAVQTRNVAGLVTRRHTDITGSPMTFVESNWTYDALGRVASQVVQKGPGPVQVARQDLAYTGSDDPTTLDEWLGTADHKQFHYSYDLRHQLLGVSESLQNSFGATYTFGDAGRFATALETTASLPGSDVAPRHVTYQYADADRERVTGLTNADGSTFASYTYDAAGNQTNRTVSTGSNDYVYDAKNQLRRATKKEAGAVTGSEEYWYDGNGARMAVVKRDATGAKTELVWFLGDAEAHYDPTGTVEHVYSHLTLGTPVARIDRTSNTTTSLELQFHGLANNTLAAVDQSGTVNASFSYAPFGELVESTGADDHRRRLNDKYADELTDLGYYGFRYYDKTLLGWTQSDPLYRFAPDLAAAQPRRANGYTFSLANPVRYIDPDGKSPADVVKQFRIPTPAEFQAIVEGYGELATARDHDWENLQERQQASKNAVEYLQRAFNVKTSANELSIVNGLSRFGAPGAGMYNHFTYTLSLDLDITDVESRIDVLEALLVLVHESIHSEQDFTFFDQPSDEIEATQGMLAVLGMLYDAQVITKEEYDEMQEEETAYLRQNEKWEVCEPCQRIPEMHQNPDLFREVYRKRTTPVYQGVWGLQINPDGPLAAPKRPQ
jgi:RHS repeat-associated protein